MNGGTGRREPARPVAARCRQRGVAMVEFAIGVPVLLLLLFVTVEVARFLNQYSILTDAVRDASRYVAGAAMQGTTGLIVQGPAWAALVAQGQNLAVYGNLAGTGAPLLPGLSVADVTVTADTVGDNVTVSAAYPYQGIFGGSMPDFMGGSVSTAWTLQIATTMRAL